MNFHRDTSTCYIIISEPMSSGTLFSLNLRRCTDIDTSIVVLLSSARLFFLLPPRNLVGKPAIPTLHPRCYHSREKEREITVPALSE